DVLRGVLKAQQVRAIPCAEREPAAARSQEERERPAVIDAVEIEVRTRVVVARLRVAKEVLLEHDREATAGQQVEPQREAAGEPALLPHVVAPREVLTKAEDRRD